MEEGGGEESGTSGALVFTHTHSHTVRRDERHVMHGDDMRREGGTVMRHTVSLFLSFLPRISFLFFFFLFRWPLRLYIFLLRDVAPGNRFIPPNETTVPVLEDVVWTRISSQGGLAETAEAGVGVGEKEGEL